MKNWCCMAMATGLLGWGAGEFVATAEAAGGPNHLQWWKRKPATARDEKANFPLLDGVEMKRLTKKGGRVSWYKGRKSHELIAFDAVTGRKTTHIFTMKPDGSDRKCVTCDADIPTMGWIGQPAWHPDGEHLLFQVENENSSRTHYEHVSFGYNNDLWMIRRDGTEAQLVWKTEKDHSTLHPHFNAKGDTLIFSEALLTGKKTKTKFLRTKPPGNENPYDGWRLHVADVDVKRRGTARLFNHRTIFDDTGGFYEAHGFTHDDKNIVFSYTAGGQFYVDDIYVSNLRGESKRNILHSSPSTWDEMGVYSPSGRHLAFISSRFFPSWQAPRDNFNSLRLELALMDERGKVFRVTSFNQSARRSKRYITERFEWDRTGKRLVLHVPSFGPGPRIGDYEIWLLTFPEEM